MTVSPSMRVTGCTSWRRGCLNAMTVERQGSIASGTLLRSSNIRPPRATSAVALYTVSAARNLPRPINLPLSTASASRARAPANGVLGDSKHVSVQMDGEGALARRRGGIQQLPGH
jgi:hypothetical protein